MENTFHFKRELLGAALRVIEHEFDKADDPGWQAELDDEHFVEAAKQYVEALEKNAK